MPKVASAERKRLYLNDSEFDTFANNVLGLMNFKRITKYEVYKATGINIYMSLDTGIISRKSAGKICNFLDCSLDRMLNNVDLTRLKKNKIIDWITCEYTYNNSN